MSPFAICLTGIILCGVDWICTDRPAPLAREMGLGRTGVRT